MKKVLAVGIAVLIILVSLAGCDSETNISFNSADVEKVEVFTGSVPAQATKKIVTDEKDIKRIINGLNTLTVVREATNDDLLAGGIGTTFHFYLANGDSYTILNNGNLLSTTQGLFVVKGTSLSTDTFWNSLSYEMISVTESELPIIKIAENPNEN